MGRIQGTILRTVLIVLMLFLILGIALRYGTKQYLIEDTFRKLEHNSQVLAKLAEAYYAEGAMTNMQLIINLDLASEFSGTDVLLCDEKGKIILCSDDPTDCFHQGFCLSKDYMDRIIANEGDSDILVLTSLYEGTRQVCATPIYSSSTGLAVGVVLISTPLDTVVDGATRIYNIYLITIIFIMLMICVLTLYVSRQQGSPLRELAKTARAFGHGDLNARVMLEGKQPKEIAELALAFNNMASSLQKSEYSRQEFVANVSHELKTPMTTIGGYIDGILDGTIPPERHRYYMQIVSDETKRLSRLVRSMLDISRLQNQEGIPEEKKTRFDMEECIGEVLITFEQKIVAKNLDVQVDLPDHPVFTRADKDAVTQVVYNLLDNAVKFCTAGGELGLKLRIGGSKLYVTISNQGNTIPPEELPLVFDRFHKIDKARNRSQEGWGLGLYIVKTLVCSHGENISVASRDGKTEFTFTMPLVN